MTRVGISQKKFPQDENLVLIFNFFCAELNKELKVFVRDIQERTKRKNNIKYNLVVKEHIHISVTPIEGIPHTQERGILFYLSELCTFYFLKDLLLQGLNPFLFFYFS